MEGLLPGQGNYTPLQYSCLENPMDGGALQVAVHGVTKSQTRVSDFTFTLFATRRWKSANINRVAGSAIFKLPGQEITRKSSEQNQ